MNALLLLLMVQQPAVKVDSETVSGLGARNIGSAAMSGRIAALDAVHEGARLTIYVGAASGGVWKSTNGGTTFKPVFDKQPVQSIGRSRSIRRIPKSSGSAPANRGCATACPSAMASIARTTPARTGRTWDSRTPSTS